ncbi:hypothetical protein CIK05_01235 [Bdellovibrio sp. qaytius]|nr:hypothetical protein CIK05_01235 [Bdellovibrio sp. qaytius]
MKINIFIIIFILPLLALAQLKETEETFLVDDWSDGLHIFVGAGINHSKYRSDTQNNNLGLGVNLKTDVGWYFNDKWAIESSASVKFNTYHDDLIWDTLLTLGARYRIEDYYFRGFAGAGVLVVVLNEDEPTPNDNTKRIHMDGPALGLGFGRIKLTEAGKVWFIELNATAQEIRHRDDVAVDGQYPIAISSQAVNDNSTIYSAQFTIGVLLF